MKQIHRTIPVPDDPCTRHYFTERHAFFDIETTGFSPQSAFVYLIGLALRKGGSIHIHQFLAADRTEEGAILSAFHDLINGMQTLVTFNGLVFDIPFLKAREAVFQIEGGWDSFACLDLYKIIGKYARLLGLPDKKQKTFEHFLGIGRDDALSGGALIPIYYAYEAHPSPSGGHLLLLHNFEDVLGMTKLLGLMAYADFFSQPKRACAASFDPASGLSLTLDAPLPFPKEISCRGRLCGLTCSGSSARLQIDAFCGELKFFYSRYADYYYLPEEDMAIHKSVAGFVNSKYRKKATAATCYTKKTGIFLPQEKPLFTPVFQPEKKAAVRYFELTGEFLSDAVAQSTYAAHLIDTL